MDDIVIAAYCELVHSCKASADDILVDPDLRARFLAFCSQRAPDVPERAWLHRLISLRKRGCLPRSRALLASPTN